MKHRYKLGNGIAMSPERDMILLKSMSARGWHLCGTLLWWYRFERGEPADYDYSSNMESCVTEDMLAMYAESGWTPVITCEGIQIFRARAGAVPIFTDPTSEIESLVGIRRDMLKRAAIWGAALIAIGLAAHIHPGMLTSVLAVLAAAAAYIWVICFVPNLLGFFGVWRLLAKKRRSL